jgi:hypothetical protein
MSGVGFNLRKLLKRLKGAGKAPIDTLLLSIFWLFLGFWIKSTQPYHAE